MISARYLTGSYSNMETVISKRHIYNFYIVLFITSAFLLGIGALFLFSFINKIIGRASMREEHYLMPIIPIALAGFTFHFISEFIKKVPRITINEHYITFDKSIFPISDIDYIKFSGTKDFILGRSLECTMVVFKNNTAKLIFDDLYSNSPAIKTKLDSIIYNKQHQAVRKIKNINKQHFYYYKGSLIYSISGLTLLFLLGMFIVLGFKSKSSFGIIFMSIFILFIFAVFQNQFNYFGISDDYFVIKNHLKFWKKEFYNISDIEEAVLEYPSKSPMRLKLFFKDYTTRKHYAASLSEKNWKELKKDLIKSNIKFRNEYI